MRVYVKCMQKKNNGTARFHKDGYTDLRGTFDYAFLNSEPDIEIKEFALFV